jgi:hypothetical protein
MTWPKEVQTLVEDFLTDYIQIIISLLNLVINHNIIQNTKDCEESKKEMELIELLKSLTSNHHFSGYQEKSRGFAVI